MHPTRTRDDAYWLDRVVDLAVGNVADGGGPFAAVVVRDSDLIASGRNRVTLDLDPSAHAEVTAIRAACQAVGDFSLAGYTLYGSCEPCPMCMATALWARLDRIVYAADRHDAARGGFDDLAFYDLFTDPDAEWPAVVEHARHARSLEPFEAWVSNPDRIEY